MTALDDFHSCLAQCPVVAVLRGVTPDTVEEVGEALFDGGVRIIEVPLNSPDPLRSIERLARRFEGRALTGAGTVLSTDAVADVHRAGGRIVVSPNANPAVIAATVAAGMVSAPGFFTPTEAIAALAAGAHALKFFPAEAASPAVLKAQRAVLPRDTPILVVGGIMADTVRPWLDAGASGFGIGSALFVPGRSPDEVRDRTRRFVAALAR